MASPSEHYEKAERLLERSEKLTEDWVTQTGEAAESMAKSVANMKLLHLEILSRMLTSRAEVHARLASASYQQPHRLPVANYAHAGYQGDERIIDVPLPQ
jgi:hypothetical protein